MTNLARSVTLAPSGTVGLHNLQKALGMNSKFDDGVEDVQQALTAGRELRGHGPYGVLIGNEQLEFVPVVIADPVPTGRQILQALGVNEPLEHLVFQIGRAHV